MTHTDEEMRNNCWLIAKKMFNNDLLDENVHGDVLVKVNADRMPEVFNPYTNPKDSQDVQRHFKISLYYDEETDRWYGLPLSNGINSTDLKQIIADGAVSLINDMDKVGLK
jgi:hypothetical protein